MGAGRTISDSEPACNRDFQEVGRATSRTAGVMVQHARLIVLGKTRRQCNLGFWDRSGSFSWPQHRFPLRERRTVAPAVSPPVSFGLTSFSKRWLQDRRVTRKSM